MCVTKLCSTWWRGVLSHYRKGSHKSHQLQPHKCRVAHIHSPYMGSGLVRPWARLAGTSAAPFKSPAWAKPAPIQGTCLYAHTCRRLGGASLPLGSP